LLCCLDKLYFINVIKIVADIVTAVGLMIAVNVQNAVVTDIVTAVDWLDD
jgi:hypothetical protein